MSRRPHDFDVIVVGAGPGGATSAALAARSGQRVLLLDQAPFPRDKVCGDAVSGKSVDVLRELGALDTLLDSDVVPCWGVKFSAPSGAEVDVPFTKEVNPPVPPGFVTARTTFDKIVFDCAVQAGADVRTGTRVTGLLRDRDRICGVRMSGGETSDGADSEATAPLVIGADGAYSVVARELGFEQLVAKHYCAGLRAYYTGVTGFHERNYIELHYVRESIPGYFWIFPMGGGRANVGVGMLSSIVKQRDVNLRAMLDMLVQHPRFAERFKGAERQGRVRGWGLPLGSKPRPMAGDGWMLVGDAASLIDPFTGEGIGNAMVSGWSAATWSARAAEASDYTAAFLAGYDREVTDRLSGELRLSHGLQRLGRWQWLLNTVIRKASRSRELADAITCMFDDLDQRRRLLSPLFYLRVLTA